MLIPWKRHNFVPFMLLAPMIAIGGCGISRNDGKALGNAGYAASTTIEDQANAAERLIQRLPEVQSINAAFGCRHEQSEASRTRCAAKAEADAPEDLRKAYGQLSVIAEKRALAAQQLAKAYKGFAALADYNAGEETEKALKATFTSLNELSKVAGAVTGSGPLFPTITETFTAAGSAIGGVIADWNQSRQLLTASKDLHRANDALITALKFEESLTGWNSLLRTLHAERAVLVKTAVGAGLVSPVSVLQPLFTEIAPGVELVKTPSSADARAIRDAAVAAFAHRSRAERLRLTATYGAAISTLVRLSEEHEKLEKDRPLDIAAILNQVDRLQGLLK